MKLLVILRGRPTSGKTTALRTLKNKKDMKDWIFIDHSAIKTLLGKEKGKKKLHELLKKALLTGKNILTEETSRETLKKYIGKELKESKYKIIVFQFWVSTKTALKRDVHRAKNGWHLFMGKNKIKELHKMHDERQDKEAVLVNTDKLNKKQVIEFIIKELKKDEIKSAQPKGL